MKHLELLPSLNNQNINYLEIYDKKHKFNCFLLKISLKIFVTCFLYIISNINLKSSINNIKSEPLINSYNNIKLCICTPGKKENRYIREFVIYYEKYGVDKIFLYDYNDIYDEHF